MSTKIFLAMGGKRGWVYTLSVYPKTEEEELIVRLWVELMRLKGADRGKRLFDMMKEEVEGLQRDDPQLYDALKVIVLRRMEEGGDD